MFPPVPVAQKNKAVANCVDLYFRISTKSSLCHDTKTHQIAFFHCRFLFLSDPSPRFILSLTMPCEAHTIFFSCGHVFLAKSKLEEAETTADDALSNESKDTTSSLRKVTPYEAHAAPRGYPCNTYAPYTINISSTSCNECAALPKGVKLQMLGADPEEIVEFDSFTKQWVEQVRANMRMESDLKEAALKNLTDKSTTTDVERTAEEKREKEMESQRLAEEDDLLDWEEADTEEYAGVGKE